ncbi:uncharacterized protein LDX57_011831 [Aspergillus melleus]|uniref:uncharacterized protein n=1 Tax=Aspergillus melleus TaxID=138277 RepID=UPI001E8E3B44|nr:uncharacterized protein LDX57_011831 [Aspergillus melleus]KAH8434192.1 hypothetical protein LDX57_011831 [Aspergillus melleus]
MGVWIVCCAWIYTFWIPKILVIEPHMENSFQGTSDFDVWETGFVSVRCRGALSAREGLFQIHRDYDYQQGRSDAKGSRHG